MIRSGLIFLFLLFITCGSLKAQYGDSFPIGKRRMNIPAFNKQIEELLLQSGVPALSLAIIDNNQVVFYHNYGYKNKKTGEKVDENTLFEACSLSKQFLVFLAHKMVDEGKLDLDKPVYQYLKFDLLEYDPRYKLITSRMILNHSSGLENWARENNPDKLEIISNPGDHYTYSGEGYNYLARVMALLLGETEEVYFDKLVFNPLQLHHTYSHFTADGKFPADYAVGHTKLDQKVEKWINSTPIPSSAINTTAEDYAKLVIGTFDQKHLSEKSIKDILAPETKLEIDGNYKYYWGSGYGIQYSPQDTIVFQSGSNDGFKSWVNYSVVNKSGLVYFTNSDLGMSIGNKLNEITLNTKSPIEKMADLDYQSDILVLLNIYKTRSAEAMFAGIDSLLNKRPVSVETLNILGWIIAGENKVITENIFKKNIKIHPNAAAAYANLGNLYMQQKDYSSAIKCLTQCKTLDPLYENADAMIRECQQRSAEIN